ncbi:MAG TPA: hypothetical protein VG742_20485 [Dongiaceae bacterium]|nr:hypothetical protein [Dongiaceae bacterium]
MTELRYPLSALFWDYVRGVAGIVICFVILVTNEWQNQLAWLFAGLTVLFAIYTMTTIAKNLTRFWVTEEGIECGGFRRQTIRWADLAGLSLRYYPTSRSRKKGWMSLTLKDEKSKIQIDSNLPGFSEIVARAAHAARENKLMVDRVTADNMAAIGVAG